MSQSDYIQHLKVATELKLQSKLSPVLTSDNYTAFKQFNIENTVYNTSRRHNQLVPTGTQIVFDMPMPNASRCSTFLLCSNTQNRPNRVPMSTVYFHSLTCKPLPVYVKHKPLRTCAKCCYAENKTNINNFNTDSTDCSNKRKNLLYCKCTSI